jgi:predicted SprT family Zn-dependent metalloprotease
MEIDVARRLALQLMREHGWIGRGWALRIGRAMPRIGSCHGRLKRITLSGPLITINDETEVRDTIFHEMAHALAGTTHGHDRVWKATAEAVGCRPRSCHSAQEVRVPPARYRFECPACGHAGTRMHVRVSSCGRCDPKRFNRKYLLRRTDLHAAV